MAEQLRLEDLKKKRMGPPLPNKPVTPTKMADSAGATGGSSFPRNPYASEGGVSTNQELKVNPLRKTNSQYTREDLYKGANSEGSILRANNPQKKPIINMKAGMGNSPDGYNRANGMDISEASTELLGSAVHMINKKGKSFDNARQSLQTLGTFKGLSESGRNYALAAFDRWRATQLNGNNNTMGNIRRASQSPKKQPQTFSQTQADRGDIDF